MKDIRSLSRAQWNCKYHVVFAPKYRRQVIYEKLKAGIVQILRKLGGQKGVKTIETEACPDHIHMLVGIGPSMSVVQFVGIS